MTIIATSTVAASTSTTTTTTPAFVGRKTGGPDSGPGYWARVTRARVPVSREALRRLEGRVAAFVSGLRADSGVSEWLVETIAPGIVRVDYWWEGETLATTTYITGGRAPARAYWPCSRDLES